MTAPVFTPITDPLYALCPECRAMETLDADTGRCRLCWREWRWSVVGWARAERTATAVDYDFLEANRCTNCGRLAKDHETACAGKETRP